MFVLVNELVQEQREVGCADELFVSRRHIGIADTGSWIASSQRPIAVRALRLKDYFTAPVRGAFEHLVGLPAFVEPEHFTNLSL